MKQHGRCFTDCVRLWFALVRDQLTGTVQVDEIYIGGPRPGKRGRGAEDKTLVVISVEDKGNRAGRIRLHKVKDASGASLIMAIKVEYSIQQRSLYGWLGRI